MGREVNQKLVAEAIFLKYLDQRDWALETNLPHWLTISVPQWRNVRWLSETFSEILQGWAMATRVFFRYADGKYAELSSKGELMKIAIAGIPANRALLDVFGMMLSSPDRSLSLVHVPTQRQFVVNGGKEGQFMLSVDPKQASQWRRPQYWMPQWLDQFDRDWRRDMQPDSDSWYEYTYLIDSRAPIEERPVQSADYQLTSRYRLILGPNDEPFHLGENLEMEKIGENQGRRS